MKNRFITKLLALTLTATLLLTACGGRNPGAPSGSSDPGSISSEGAGTDGETVYENEVFLLEKIDKAKEKNKDTKGWLYIPNTTIDNSVLQAADNEYYLRLNEDKKYDIFGCYFADYENNLTSRDKMSKNTIIYGHSDLKDNKDGPKFSQLFRYTDLDFAKKNPYIYFSTGEEDMVWEVFAVFYTHIDFHYIAANPSTNEFNKIISEAKARSEYIIDTPVSDSDKILTLSTCAAKYNPKDKDNYRLVVMAKLVPSGTQLKSELGISKNPSPKKS